MLKYSEEESKLYNLKVGRADIEELEENALLESIIQNNYDLCRIKVNSKNSNIISQLENINFQYFFSGAITTYKIDFSKEPIRPYRDANVEFEPYDGKKNELFQKLLREVFYDHPLSFYPVPIVEKLISKENQQLGLSSYFAETQFNDDNRLAWFVKYKGEYAGILATRTWDDKKHGEGTLSGVIPKYKNTGLFLDIINFIQNYCIETKIRWGHTGARLHEIASHKFFTKTGMYVENSYLIFYITSLLSKTEIPPISEILENHNSDKILIINMIHEKLRKLSENFSLKKEKFYWLKNELNNKIEVTLSFPLISENEKLIVVRLQFEDSLFGIGYFEFSK